MKIEALRRLALSLVQDIEFTWNGRRGVIVPSSANEFELWYDNEGHFFSDIDDLIYVKTKVLNGLSVADIINVAEFDPALV